MHPAEAKCAIGVDCAQRSLRRHLRTVRAALLAIVTLLPERLSGLTPTITALREALGTERVLVSVRCIAERHLGALPTPLGFGSRASA